MWVPQSRKEEWSGEETTEESEGELTHFNARRREILETAQTAFADAGEEYGTLDAVKGRLESWKADHPGAYRDAYMALSAPAIFAPFVRLELLGWEPVLDGESGASAALKYKKSCLKIKNAVLNFKKASFFFSSPWPKILKEGVMEV